MAEAFNGLSLAAQLVEEAKPHQLEARIANLAQVRAARFAQFTAARDALVQESEAAE